MSYQLENSFNAEKLNACGDGLLFGPGNAQLPKPPMLMFDRITNINQQGGFYAKGEITAELDVNPELWFFNCHFVDDPVMPGCLGLDAMWQLLGFYLGWCGNPGRGRALGLGKLKFSGQVLPSSRLLRYQIDVKRVLTGKLIMAIADGKMYVDDELVYEAHDLRCGLFVNQ